MTYTRERYNGVRSFPPGAFTRQQEDWLRQNGQDVLRGIPHPPVTIDMRSFAQPGRDFAAAVQRAHDALPSTGGTILFPRMSAAWLLDGNGATVAAPKRGVNITKNNVWIVGDGDTPVHMANWDQTDAASAGADTAGRDVFTVIRFTADVVGGGVWGFYVTGESDDSSLSVGEARAKFVGIDGAERIQVTHCHGVDLVGNLVCARGNNTAAGAAGPASYNLVAHCYAENCAENGVNFMGGTFDSVFANNVCKDNEFQGFESGCDRLTCTGNHFIGNTNGMSHVGRHATIANNVARNNENSGIHMQWNDATNFDASHNLITGNVCYDNDGAASAAGILCDGDTHHNVIRGNHCRDNGASAGAGIQLSTDCEDYLIEGNFCYDSGGATQDIGINVVASNNITLIGNWSEGHSTAGIAIQGASDRVTLIGNDGQDTTPVSIASTATSIYQRSNRGFSQSNPAQITSNQNDYAPTGQWAETWRLSSDASRNITGIANGVQDRTLRIINAGSNTIVLQNENAGSVAANRITTGTAADASLGAGDIALLWYDSVSSRWRMIDPALGVFGFGIAVTGNSSVTGTLSGITTLTCEALSGTGVSHVFGSDAGASQQVRLNAAAASIRSIAYETAGVDRWLLGVSSTAETGSDAGTNFFLNAMTDAGATIDSVLTIIRAAGGVATFSRPLAVNGTTATLRSGTGTPEGAVTAAIGSLFLRTDGGASTTLYVKESGAGNTGWVAK